MEQKIIVEDTVGAAEPNIATTDEILSVGEMFQQAQLPSLARQIFSVVPINGPTAALFNLRKKAASNAAELVRAEVEVYPSTAIKTNISEEAVQNIRSMYGIEANQIVGKLLRGLANTDENTKTLAFLEAKSVAYAGLVLSGVKNAELNLFEITQRVQEIVLKMNSKNLRTYEAFAVIPYVGLGGLMALSRYANAIDSEHRGLFVTQFGVTKFYFNPDPASTTAYVGLMDLQDPSRSSGVFSPYVSQIVESVNPDSGDLAYHIFNRFAITASPLHVLNDEMFYKFTVTTV